MTRCLIYSRVSGLAQEYDGTSLGTQEERCIAHAKANGWTIVEPPSRETWTGFQLRQRKKLTRLRDMIKAGQADVLLVFDLDRLSRNQTHVAVIDYEFEPHDARIETVTEPYDQSAVGKHIRSSRAFASELEREKIRERTWRAIKSQASVGRRLSGPRPRYGYQWADVTLPGGKVWPKARLVEDETTGPVVRRIFDLAWRGTPTRKIAMTLTAEGIATPKGGDTWTHTVIRLILKDALYTGEAVAFRYQTAVKKDGKKRDRTIGETETVTERAADDQERVVLPEGTVEPLIDPASFAAVQARMQRTKAETAGRRRHPEAALLRTGFATCASCSARLIVYQNGKGIIGYRCPGKGPDGAACTGRASMAAHLLDPLVWNRVRVALADDEGIAAEVERQLCAPVAVDSEIATIEALIERTKREQAAIARQVSRITADVDEETADLAAAPLRTRLIELAKQGQELAVELSARRAVKAQRGAADTWIATIRAQLGNVAAMAETLDYNGRRDLLDLLGVTVRLHRADHAPRVEIDARIDLSRWAWVDTLSLGKNGGEIDLTAVGRLPRPQDVTAAPSVAA